MADTDQAQEAVERLEYLDREDVGRGGIDRRAFLRRTALTGMAAGSASAILSACGSSASSGSSSGGGSASIFGSHPIVQIRGRQPRDDQPVLRAHPVRHRRRVQAARLLLRVDGLGKQKHRPDGQRHQHRRVIRRRRDRGLADQHHRVQRARRKRAEGGHPGRRLQRRRPLQQAPFLHRPGPETGRRTDGQTDRRRRGIGRRGDLHRHVRARRTCSRGSKGRKRRSRTRARRSR